MRKSVKDENGKNIVLLLQYLKEVTDIEGDFKGSLRSLYNDFNIKSQSVFDSVIRRQSMIVGDGPPRNRTYKYASAVEPNIKMAEKIMTEMTKEARKQNEGYIAKVKAEKLAKKQFKISKSYTKPKEPTDSPNAESILDKAKREGIIQPNEKQFKIKTDAEIVSEGKIISRDLFNLLQRLQSMAMLKGELSSREVNVIVREAMMNNPSMEKAFEKFIMNK